MQDGRRGKGDQGKKYGGRSEDAPKLEGADKRA